MQFALCDNLVIDAISSAVAISSAGYPSLSSLSLKWRFHPQGVIFFIVGKSQSEAASNPCIYLVNDAQSLPKARALSGGTKWMSPFAKQRSCSGLKMYILQYKHINK